MINGTEIVLASQSPRRKELLSMLGKEFTVITVQTDETIAEGSAPQAAVEELAARKALAAARLPQGKGKLVIGADTVVVLDGKIYGKPCSEQEAFQMLTCLSGRIHQVYTGVCVVYPDGTDVRFHEKTDVEFYPNTPQRLWDYINTGEPMDKAGAYGIQGKGALLVKRIDGDYYNVVGLPVGRLAQILFSFAL